MSYIHIRGNLFNSKAQVLVNTVNCVGDMGKGIALEFKWRFPDMFAVYHDECKQKLYSPGRIRKYELPDGRMILNFAVKDDWRFPSKLEWVEGCLIHFSQRYQKENIHSMAIPWLGAMNGGIPIADTLAMMEKYLANLPGIDIEVYEYDALAPDPLFDTLTKIATSAEPELFQLALEDKKEGKVNLRGYNKIIEAVRSGEARCLSEVVNLPGIDKGTIEPLYLFLTNFDLAKLKQINAIKLKLIQEKKLKPEKKSKNKKQPSESKADQDRLL
jgi:hypothetical protein